MIPTTGWRSAEGPIRFRVSDRQAHALLYNPDAHRALRVTLDAQSLHRPRQVRLLCEGRELARWEVRQGAYQTLASPPFELAAGLHDLVLESKGVSRPVYLIEAVTATDMRPYSLKICHFELDAADAVARR
jgi:hypothetical protein